MWPLLLLACSGPSGLDTAPSAVDTANTSAEVLGSVSLMDAAAFEEVFASDDPFADRPATVTCSTLGYGEENDTFEVDTEACAYGTFRQALPHDVPVGTQILLVYWYLELWAEEEALGHLALALDDVLLFEHQVPIPSDAATHKVWLTAPRDLVAGEWLYFHVHNHGYNNWVLGVLEAEL